MEIINLPTDALVFLVAIVIELLVGDPISEMYSVTVVPLGVTCA